MRADGGAGVVGLVLAAGESRRMGPRNKLLLPVAGRPLVVRSVGALLASRIDRVHVVTGFDHEAVVAALRDAFGDDPRLRFVRNWAFEEGMGASVRTGVESLDRPVPDLLIALADMPWVQPEHVDLLVATLGARDRPAICVPTFRGRRGHPVLFDARFRDELAQCSGDIGARAVLSRHAHRVWEVPVDDDGVWRDVDGPGDLQE